jgi:hypothetical protein
MSNRPPKLASGTGECWRREVESKRAEGSTECRHVLSAVARRRGISILPTDDETCLVIDDAARRAGRAPKYTVSDQGAELGENALEPCDDHDVRTRFGVVGRHGNIGVEERSSAGCLMPGLSGGWTK